MTYNTKAGRHDDIVSAAAVAAWRLSDGAVGWGPPSAELAAMILGLGGSHPGPAPWAIGLDLGKVHHPTAIVVMRRVSVDRPELPHRDTEPMVVVPDVASLATQPKGSDWQARGPGAHALRRRTSRRVGRRRRNGIPLRPVVSIAHP